jgi:hypothetical protein
MNINICQVWQKMKKKRKFTIQLQQLNTNSWLHLLQVASVVRSAVTLLSFGSMMGTCGIISAPHQFLLSLAEKDIHLPKRLCHQCTYFILSI